MNEENYSIEYKDSEVPYLIITNKTKPRQMESYPIQYKGNVIGFLITNETDREEQEQLKSNRRVLAVMQDIVRDAGYGLTNVRPESIIISKPRRK